MAILQELSQLSISETGLKFAYLKFHSNLPGANELIDLRVSKFHLFTHGKHIRKSVLSYRVQSNHNKSIFFNSR